jgi:hypothetical protein
MNEQSNEQAVRRLLEAFNARRWEDYAAEMTSDAELEYPQSGERFVGPDMCIAQVTAAPAAPHLQLQRMKSGGDLVVAEMDEVYDSGDSWKAVLVFEFKDGKIAREIGYWGKTFSAPHWRKPFAAK